MMVSLIENAPPHLSVQKTSYISFLGSRPSLDLLQTESLLRSAINIRPSAINIRPSSGMNMSLHKLLFYRSSRKSSTIIQVTEDLLESAVIRILSTSLLLTEYLIQLISIFRYHPNFKPHKFIMEILLTVCWYSGKEGL